MSNTSNPLLSIHPHFNYVDTSKKFIDRRNENDSEKTTIIKSIIGLLVFFIIFVVLIPYLIKKTNNVDLLLVYLMNLDMIANILNFRDGPFDTGIFRYLYTDNRPLIGFINQNIINFVVLVIITYVVIDISLKNNNHFDGLSKAIIIFLITYLFPSRFIHDLMYSLYDYLIKYSLNSDLVRFLTIIAGFILSVLIILLEFVVTKNTYKYISSFLKSNLTFLK